MKLIHSLMGKLTLPEDVYVDSLGDYWVESTCADVKHEMFSDHPYIYTRIIQNKYGKWIKQSEFLRKHTPLKKLGE